MSAEDIRAAARRVETSRSRIQAGLEDLHQRIDPRFIARELIDGAKAKSHALADTARQTASDQRNVIGGAAAGLLFMLGLKAMVRWVRNLRWKRRKAQGLVTAEIAREDGSKAAYGNALNPILVEENGPSQVVHAVH